MLGFIIKMQQAIAESRREGREDGYEEGLETGIAKGRAEVYRAWYADWDRRRRDAIARELPFTEPPPANPENGTGQ